MFSSGKSVIVIGAGMAGLSAAYELSKQGLECLVLEQSDRPGGRVRTDHTEGYALDHGFQVLLTAYPETQRLLDYAALELGYFRPGAVVAGKGKRWVFEDPLRAPARAIETALNPVATFSDKWKVFKWRKEVLSQSIEALFEQDELTAREALRQRGFSQRIIRSFFEPFFGGIFLERELTTSRRMLDFVFQMFSSGYAALPRGGMEQIPRQVADRLPPDSLRYGKRVVELNNNIVLTEEGERFEADAVLLATEATGLVSQLAPHVLTAKQQTRCYYFTAPESPMRKPYLVLNAQRGMVNNVAVLSDAAADYAPAGRTLISVSVVGGDQLGERTILKEVKTELKRIFGKPTDQWEHLETYQIGYALPQQRHVRYRAPREAFQLDRHLYVCGDHLLYGSLNAAIASGRMAAQQISEQLMVGSFQ